MGGEKSKTKVGYGGFRVPGGEGACVLNKMAGTGFTDRVMFELRLEDDEELSHNDV